MQQLAEAAMEKEAYAEEVGLFSAPGLYCCLTRLLCIFKSCKSKPLMCRLGKQERCHG